MDHFSRLLLKQVEHLLIALAQWNDYLSAFTELIYQRLFETLKKLGLEPIAATGQPFDPNLCQAVGVVDVPDPAQDGMVKEEVLRGYRLGEQVLRPANVMVGRHS